MRAGLRRYREARQQCAGVVEFGYPPGLSADVRRTVGDRHQRRHRVRRRQPDAGVAAGQQQRGRIVDEVHADVGAESGDVAAAVVDAEPEPARQRGQRRARPESRCPARSTQPRTSPRPPTRPDSGDATMLRTRSWVADGSSPAAGDGVGDGAGVGDPAQSGCCRATSVPACREPNPAAACASASSCCGRDHPAGQPHPDQRAVGGLVHLQRAGAGVLVTGSGHVLYRTAATCVRSPRNGVVRYSCLAQVTGRTFLTSDTCRLHNIEYGKEKLK